ncbi:MAG: nucleotidyltransferase family protein [Candidatus Pacearchaeota archaeon]|nr:nucleotidyltransferase family protein [Candidatus Pacearchaeota archaeon]
MVYTEVKTRNEKKYYYRVISIRKGKKVSKKRRYLGVNLTKNKIYEKERKADQELLEHKSKKINNNLKEIKSKIIPLLKKNKVKRAGIFGSYVRGEQKKTSDIDILIEPPKGMGLGFIALERDLSERLGKKVDLLTYNGIYHRLKKRILSEEVRII